jgi:hypothetical protein
VSIFVDLCIQNKSLPSSSFRRNGLCLTVLCKYFWRIWIQIRETVNLRIQIRIQEVDHLQILPDPDPTLFFVVIEKICLCQTGNKSSMFLLFIVESEHFAEISSGLWKNNKDRDPDPGRPINDRSEGSGSGTATQMFVKLSYCTMNRFISNHAKKSEFLFNVSVSGISHHQKFIRVYLLLATTHSFKKIITTKGLLSIVLYLISTV